MKSNIDHSWNIAILSQEPGIDRLGRHLTHDAAFARRKLTDDVHQNRIFSVGNTFDGKKRMHQPRSNVSGRFTEWSFMLQCFGTDFAFDYNLCPSGHDDVHGLATNNIDGSPC